jgi:hypothetical protein
VSRSKFDFKGRHRGLNGVEYYDWLQQDYGDRCPIRVRIPVQQFWDNRRLRFRQMLRMGMGEVLWTAV